MTDRLFVVAAANRGIMEEYQEMVYFQNAADVLDEMPLTMTFLKINDEYSDDYADVNSLMMTSCNGWFKMMLAANSYMFES